MPPMPGLAGGASLIFSSSTSKTSMPWGLFG